MANHKRLRKTRLEAEGPATTIDMEPEVIYSGNFSPDPASAIDVLAFLFTPASAFATPGDEEDLIAATMILREAKQEAMDRWIELSKLPKGKA